MQCTGLDNICRHACYTVIIRCTLQDTSILQDTPTELPPEFDLSMLDLLTVSSRTVQNTGLDIKKYVIMLHSNNRMQTAGCKLQDTPTELPPAASCPVTVSRFSNMVLV